MVYLGRWRGQPAAVKQIGANVVGSAGMDTVLAEVRIMMRLNMRHHVNIVHLVGVCLNKHRDLYLVVEFFSLGSLDKALERTSALHAELCPLPVRRQLARDIASGVEVLHKEGSGILHGDLAARNVLLRRVDGRILAGVADFGLATMLAGGAQSAVAAGRPVPTRWTAPEILSATSAYVRASDVWSFGVVLFELHSLGSVKEPYEGLTDAQVIELVVKKRGTLPQPPECPTQDYKLMKQCWAYIPDHRPSVDEIGRSLEVIAS